MEPGGRPSISNPNPNSNPNSHAACETYAVAMDPPPTAHIAKGEPCGENMIIYILSHSQKKSPALHHRSERQPHSIRPSFSNLSLRMRGLSCHPHSREAELAIITCPCRPRSPPPTPRSRTPSVAGPPQDLFLRKIFVSTLSSGRWA